MVEIKIKNYRIGFLVLLVIGLLIALYAWNAYDRDTTVQYGYLDQAQNFLEKAKQADSLEEKKYNINQSFQVYQNGSRFKGPNFEQVKALSLLNDTRSIDSLIPNIQDMLDDEEDDLVYPPHIWVLGGIGLVYLVLTFLGVALDYDDWKEEDKKKFLTIIFVFLLVLIIAILP